MSLHDDTAAYLLGALSDEERSRFEEHLTGCEACRRELAELKVAADALPVGVQQMAAPAALKGRIMATVRSEAELLAAAGADADRPVERAPTERRRWAGWFGWRSGLALACALLIGVAVGLNVSGSSQSQVLTAQVAPQGASVTMEVRDGHSTLSARNLPAPPSGRVYQVWLKRRGVEAPEPTDSLFSPRGGSASVDVAGSMDDVEAVLVTHEPAGGSSAPTTQPIIAIDA